MTSEITKLASLRKSIAEIKGKRDAMLKKVTEDVAYQSLGKQLAELTVAEEIVMSTVKAQAEAQYVMDGNKKPGNGVKIKTFSVPVYNPVDALVYCKANLPAALSLSVKSFEAVAKTGTLPENVVTIREEPRIQIASDLSAFLPKQAEEELPF